MDFSPALDFLKNEIGLNAESIGSSSIEKAVFGCMKICGVNSVDDYVQRLTESSAELMNLIESVVISETSFFRDKAPFTALKKYIEQFGGIKPTLRILSVPCSTGEEPYSIAMTLFDLKLSYDQFIIDSIDVSESALNIARTGIYSHYSFRGDDLGYQNRYFTKHNDRFLLRKKVRNSVNFDCANIFSASFLRGQQPYDIIFCRNLLIYFDDDTKNKAIKILSKHLNVDGLLFVGHAETSKMSQSGYVSLDYPKAFAFARQDYAIQVNERLNCFKNDTVFSPKLDLLFPQLIKVNNSLIKAKPELIQVQPLLVKSQNVNVGKKTTKNKGKQKKNIKSEKIEQSDQRVEIITKVKMLIEEGALGEAGAICNDLLSGAVESANLYYMIGRAADAIGDYLMAEEYLQKAVYLDPTFYDALIDLSALFKRMDNTDKAESFLKRAERVKLRS